MLCSRVQARLAISGTEKPPGGLLNNSSRSLFPARFPDSAPANCLASGESEPDLSWDVRAVSKKTWLLVRLMSTIVAISRIK